MGYSWCSLSQLLSTMISDNRTSRFSDVLAAQTSSSSKLCTPMVPKQVGNFWRAKEVFEFIYSAILHTQEGAAEYNDFPFADW
jgi:hypothetical protein